MKLTFSPEYSMDILKKEPHSMHVGEWRIEYLAFCREENKSNMPLIFLSGAFQNFSSYFSEADKALEKFPVILLDLPSQGSNDQLSPDMSLIDLAHLVQGFFDHFEITEPVNILGVSYGSLLASLYASFYPDMVNRLLLCGITPMARPSLVTKLREAIRRVEEGEMGGFAAGMLGGLINYSALEKTGLSPIHIKLLHRQIKNLTETELQRFIQNTERLMTGERFPGYPAVPCVIATGEFDHFTLPYENAIFAHCCPNSTMALIRNADHLSMFEQQDAVIDLFFRYLMGEELVTNEFYRVIPSEDYLSFSRRLDRRILVENVSCKLVNIGNGKKLSAVVDNLSFYGAGITLKNNPVGDDWNHNYTMTIDGIKGLEDFEFHYQILKNEEGKVRGQFLHTDLDIGFAFRDLMEEKINEFDDTNRRKA